MGTPIDNHIKILKSYHNGFSGWVSNIQDSIDVAVDIMHKYQKIEQIMKSKKMNALDIGLLIPKDMACVLHEIKEVIEDGNK